MNHLRSQGVDLASIAITNEQLQTELKTKVVSQKQFLTLVGTHPTFWRIQYAEDIHGFLPILTINLSGMAFVLHLWLRGLSHLYLKTACLLIPQLCQVADSFPALFVEIVGLLKLAAALQSQGELELAVDRVGMVRAQFYHPNLEMRIQMQIQSVGKPRVSVCLWVFQESTLIPTIGMP